MKLSAKPISSPGRAEKYPPPLMRFLRSNVGSRSRGRSRSSPMFVRKKNTAIETQEPSSPKVTCMGQVRVKRSKQAGTKPGRPGPPTRRRNRCKWIRNVLFCHHFAGKAKAKPSFRPTWKKWGPFFQMGSCRKSKTREDSSKFGNKIEDSVEGNEEEESEKNEKEAKIFVSSSCSSPPKNALILTRCRSAPYRSSSLACRFWGSPLANQETREEETEETEEENRENRGLKKEEEDPTSEKLSICRNSDHGSQMDSEKLEKSGFCKEFEESKTEKPENNEELKTEQFGNVRPLILTRCKSEPARTAERLDPEMSFWKKRRLGFT
ncbi:uncharacterized protein LOC110420884 [Herrania umbratica]|uniref:Uncharacterized protein LOC110420884 n=1 Tax=Herrania umbratica TaxID=108875 RepID=A0A6J1AU21_9ROSI|nr:uncharacterized protein LOC110420884 [Herrania umbratica]